MPQFIPRIGLALVLNDELSNVEWYGSRSRGELSGS